LYVCFLKSNTISEQKKNKLLQQSLSLFGSSLILVAIGFAIKFIQTRALGDIDYGEYAFFASLTTFLILFFRFGLYSSLQTLWAHNYNVIREKKLLGVGYIISLVNGILMAMTIWLAGFIVNDLFNTGIGEYLQLLAPLTFIFPFELLIASYSTGTNKIKIYAIAKFAPKLIFLAALLYFHFYSRLTLSSTILLNLVSTIAYSLILLIRLKPDFSDLKSTFSLVWMKNKKYGFHEYTGSVIGQATYQMDQLFISAFINTTQLGFYSLAVLICTPMIMLSQAVARSIFRSYSSRETIPKKIIKYNFYWLAFCVVFLYFTSEFIVTLIFGDAFLVTAEYILPLSVAFFVHGLYIPYSFLEAKSKGKELRNAKIVEAVVNIVGNIILIPILFVYGAIITSIFAKLVHFIMIRRYYMKHLEEKGLTEVS